MEPANEGNAQRLMEMEMGTLLQDGVEERWEAISDLDAFFSRVYEYFNQRGLRCILTSRIISLLTLVFTIILTVFLFDVMNWQGGQQHTPPALMPCLPALPSAPHCDSPGRPGTAPRAGLLEECVDDHTCATVRLVKPDALKHPGFFLSLYVTLFTLYLAWAVLHFFLDLRRVLEMRTFFRDKLHIDDVDLQAIQWDTVVQRIVELQQTSRLCIVKDQLTAHDIANRILRKENFMVAFVNRDLLPLQPFGSVAPWLGLKMLTKTLEWNIYVCILDAMFDQQFRIRQSFTTDLNGLRRRFFTAGVLNLLLSPFIAAFMMVYFFLKHAEEIHGQRANASVFARYYSRHAEWTMREFNELPHTFEARMHASLADANAYVLQFPTPLLSMIARFVTFIAGSLAAVLLCVSLLNPDVLIFYRIPPEGSWAEAVAPPRNLLWWLALLSTVLAASRSLSSQPGLMESRMQPDLLLQSLARHTHYMPTSWRGRGHTYETYREFVALYQYRLVLLLQEILGCLTTPLLLMFEMPRRAPEILEFVRSFTVYIEGVGHVCGFALFDFARHGDPRYGAPVSGEAAQQSRDGKMEKAYLNFKAHHPSWQDDTAQGEALLDNIAAKGSAETANFAAAAAAAAACAAGGGGAASVSPSCPAGGFGMGGMGRSTIGSGTVGTLGLGGDFSLSASQMMLLMQSQQTLLAASQLHGGGLGMARSSHLLTRSMAPGVPTLAESIAESTLGGTALGGASSGQLAPIDEACRGAVPSSRGASMQSSAVEGGGVPAAPGAASVLHGSAPQPPGGAGSAVAPLGSGTFFANRDTEAELLNAELYSRMDLFYMTGGGGSAVAAPAAAPLGDDAAARRQAAVEQGGPSHGPVAAAPSVA